MTVTIDKIEHVIEPYITNLGEPRLLLEIPWFEQLNLDIDWQHKTLCLSTPPTWDKYLNELSENKVIYFLGQEEEQINVKTNTATSLAQEFTKTGESDPFKLVPPEYHSFLRVFSEKESERFPPKRKWDHEIKLLDSFTPKAFPNYKLTPKEMDKLDKFLDENLAKGYIQESKSPMASPFFFISKKDGKL
ncbi:hypothetical protein AN958_06963 [Leucoagaricus sp. SymC.cos]|nr:hypothetical protein AN958_06963 [Leucoagaricus sp. SymC.cos]